MRKLFVAIAAGGTAGHINPALALAEELVSRGHQVMFVGQSHKLEGRLVPEAGYDFFDIRVTGFDRERPWTMVSALVRLRRATAALGKHFSQTRVPDVAIGFGAYVELPLLRWCAKHEVPYVIHEQNSVPGLANRTSARAASVVAVALPGACAAFEERIGSNTSLVVTGNPVRRSVVQASRAEGRRSFGVSDDQTLLLVFGGSLGARNLNNALAALKGDLLAREGLTIVHSTGEDLYDEVCASLSLSEEEATRWNVIPYIHNMGEALAAADLAVSRSGASSIAEIAALAVPSVLVPYPLATADHQTTNARYLSDCGAARLVPDAKLQEPVFRDTLLDLIDHAEVRDEMRSIVRGLAQDKSASALADQVEVAAQSE